jgi:hypothetical protein
MTSKKGCHTPLRYVTVSQKASCALYCVHVRNSRASCPLVSFINLVTVCFPARDTFGANMGL